LECKRDPLWEKHPQGNIMNENFGFFETFADISFPVYTKGTLEVKEMVINPPFF